MLLGFLQAIAGVSMVLSSESRVISGGPVHLSTRIRRTKVHVAIADASHAVARSVRRARDEDGIHVVALGTPGGDVAGLRGIGRMDEENLHAAELLSSGGRRLSRRHAPLTGAVSRDGVDE